MISKLGDLDIVILTRKNSSFSFIDNNKKHITISVIYQNKKYHVIELNCSFSEKGDLLLFLKKELKKYGLSNLENNIIDDSVNFKLLSDQINKEYKDTGERIVGSKKEKRTINSLSRLEFLEASKDFSLLDQILYYEKSRFICPYDITADKQAGLLGGICFLKDILYKKISNKPKLEGLKDEEKIKILSIYGEKLQQVWSSILRVTTYEQLKEVSYQFDYWTRKSLERIFGIQFFNVLTRQGVGFELWKKARQYDAITKQDIDKLYSEFTRRYQVMRPGSSQVSYQDFCQQANLKVKDNVYDFSVEKKTSTEKESGFVVDEKIPKLHERKILENVIRSGNVNFITDLQIDEEYLRETFGFKGVEFGNYVTDSEAKEHLRFAIGSLFDLEKVIGRKLKSIIQDGGLSLSFGSRGSRGAVAHYTPLITNINLSKKKGDGSLAHELFHYIDNYLGKKATGIGESYITELPKLNSTITQIIKQIDTRLLYTPTRKVTQKVYPDNRSRSYVLTSNLYKNKELSLEQKVQQLVDRVNGAIYSNKTQPQRDDLLLDLLIDLAGLYFKNEQVSSITVIVPLTYSDYYLGSKKVEMMTGKVGYWTNKKELFARAFESYVQEKLKSLGIDNNYLVENTEEYYFYPQGQERQRLVGLFDSLFLQISAN